MKVINLLQLLLILISVFIVISKDNLKIVIFFSTFSLVSASLYYFLRSPDLALAEVAIGSAIIPFIFIISISKQRQFLVISHINDEVHFLVNEKVGIGKVSEILNDFTKHYNLKLVINHSKYDQLHGIFRSRNVDLVIEKCPHSSKYLFKGKKSSILMNKLEQMTKHDNEIVIVKIEEGEMDD